MYIYMVGIETGLFSVSLYRVARNGIFNRVKLYSSLTIVSYSYPVKRRLFSIGVTRIFSSIFLEK